MLQNEQKTRQVFYAGKYFLQSASFDDLEDRVKWLQANLGADHSKEILIGVIRQLMGSQLAQTLRDTMVRLAKNSGLDLLSFQVMFALFCNIAAVQFHSKWATVYAIILAFGKGWGNA